MKTLALAIVVVLCGCQKNNPYFCKDHPDNNCLLDGSGSSQACTGPQDCTSTPSTPVCDTTAPMPTCVQCTATDHMLCADTSPVCGSDDMCHACVKQSDCGANGACLPDGSCGTDANTAWVAPTGSDTGTCPQATPCATLGYAVNSTAKPNIHVHGIISDDNVQIDRTVTIVADPNATIVEPGGDAKTILSVTGGSVAIQDLTISGAQGSTSYGLEIPSGTPIVTLLRVKLVGNDGGAVNANAGTLNMDRCQVVNNTGGGLFLSRTSFDVENTFITGNGVMGSSTTQFGGVFVVLPGSTHTLAFDTIAKNFAMTGTAAGVYCASTISVDNSIVFDNTGPQINMCTLTYSDVGPGTFAGDHVTNAPPAFVDETGGNFHITSSSPASGAANPSAMQPIDIDGDTRPMGLPNRDMGADEVQ